jgi:hippurate hydrolase
VVSREKDPNAFGVVTVGSIQAGAAGNVIPDRAAVRGTIRTFDAGVRDKILGGVTRTAKAVADMSGAPAPDLKITPGGRSVVNDAALTAKTATVFRQAFGGKVVQIPTATPASEDFSEFILAGVPSMYFLIGGYDPAVVAAAQKAHTPLPINHSPYFAPAPEPAIKSAVEAMSLAVIDVATP